EESLPQSETAQCNQKVRSDNTSSVNTLESRNEQPCGSGNDILQRPQASHVDQPERSINLSSIDPRQGFRISNWIRGDGTINYEADLAERQPNRQPLNKKQKVRPEQTYNYPGFRTANLVHQERQISEDEDEEDDDESNKQGSFMNRYLGRQYKKASLGYARNKSKTEEGHAFSGSVADGDSEGEEEECNEYERMRRKVRMYDENNDNSIDSLRAYNKLMYKKASLPVNVVASSFYRSATSSTTKSAFLNSSYGKVSKRSLKPEPLIASLEGGNIQQPVAVKQESSAVESKDPSSTAMPMPTTVKREPDN
uniref:Uncharacterized protein n=1 Tax=Romanomermis culicivorax TaxID=13658 RepID=A0A915LAY1_ROMCU